MPPRKSSAAASSIISAAPRDRGGVPVSPAAGRPSALAGGACGVAYSARKNRLAGAEKRETPAGIGVRGAGGGPMLGMARPTGEAHRRAGGIAALRGRLERAQYRGRRRRRHLYGGVAAAFIRRSRAT